MATHSSILAWKIPRTEEPGRVQSMGRQKVGLSDKHTQKIKCLCVGMLSHVPLLGTPWTVALQAPPSMEFSRQEYWSGLPFSTPGDLPDSGLPGWCSVTEFACQ